LYRSYQYYEQDIIDVRIIFNKTIVEALLIVLNFSRDEKEAEAFRTKELQRLKETIMKAPKNSQLTCEIVAPRSVFNFNFQIKRQIS
jgi:translation elongation factor EF-4